MGHDHDINQMFSLFNRLASHQPMSNQNSCFYTCSLNDVMIPVGSYKREWIWEDQRDLSQFVKVTKGSSGTDAIQIP